MICVEKNTKYALWIIVNIIWWMLSICLAKFGIVDVNPLLRDAGEIILNAIIFILGLVVIFAYQDES